MKRLLELAFSQHQLIFSFPVKRLTSIGQQVHQFSILLIEETIDKNWTDVEISYKQLDLLLSLYIDNFSILHSGKTGKNTFILNTKHTINTVCNAKQTHRYCLSTN